MNKEKQASGAGVNRVNCVGIRVRDLHRSRRFYETLTGIAATPERWIAGRRSGEHASVQRRIRLATLHLSNMNIDLLEHEPASDAPTYLGPGQVGGMHLCFEVDDLDAVFERMAEVGLELPGGLDWYEADQLSEGGDGTSIAYFDDPDGTRLGLIHPKGSFRRFREMFVA